jgi:hypothetical protein
MCAPSAPRPPDPRQTAAAQTGTNITTAIANNTMGMVDQVTPDGSLTNEIIGYETVTDPYTGQSNRVPRYRTTTALTQVGQQTKDQSDQAKLGLATIGNQQTGFLKDYLSQPFDGNTDAIEGRLTELGRKRLDPVAQQRRAQTETQLANQGIVPGSEAYNRAMSQLGEQENDAYNQLFLSGRGQAFQEMQATRNQPINEITALLSGSQVSQPNVQMAQPSRAPTTDVAGIINNNYSQQMQAYQQQQAQRQGLLGGLFGLGGSAITGGLFG